MSERYFIKSGKKIRGPLSLEEVNALRKRCLFENSDRISNSHNGPWKRIPQTSIEKQREIPTEISDQIGFEQQESTEEEIVEIDLENDFSFLDQERKKEKRKYLAEEYRLSRNWLSSKIELRITCPICKKHLKTAKEIVEKLESGYPPDKVIDYCPKCDTLFFFPKKIKSEIDEMFLQEDEPVNRLAKTETVQNTNKPPKKSFGTKWNEWNVAFEKNMEAIGNMMVLGVVFLLCGYCYYYYAFAEWEYSTSSSQKSSKLRDDLSEENRQFVRDKMIENGTDPTDAEVFTRELYKAEREFRKNN